jgi:hypothetical protein
MELIEREKLVDKLKSTHGKIFSVCFIKRTDNSKRVMNARFGVKSHLKGGKLPYEPKEKELLSVFDMNKKGYRSIGIENIISAKISGGEYIVKK